MLAPCRGAGHPAVSHEMIPSPGNCPLWDCPHSLPSEVGSVRKGASLQTPLPTASGSSCFWVVTSGHPSVVQVAGSSPMFLLHTCRHLKGVILHFLPKHVAVCDYFVGKGFLECVLSCPSLAARLLITAHGCVLRMATAYLWSLRLLCVI